MRIACVYLTLYLVLSSTTGACRQAVTAQAQSESQLEQLDAWLKERQLDRLSTRLAETRLAREGDASARNRLATELAERYRLQFFSNPSKSAIEPFISKAESLIQNYPEVKTPGLELAICHAQYLHAEQEFLAWWRSGATAERRGEVLENFRPVRDHLQQQIDWNQSLQQQIIAFLPDNEQENRNRQQQLDEIESRIIHANYLAGWSSYFLAIVPIQNDPGLLVQAQTAFYRTLRIEQEKPIDEIDAKWFDFSSPLSRGTLMGLALVYAAQEKSNPHRFCLATARKMGNNNDDLEIWQFNALVYAKQWAQAVEFVRSLDSESSTAEPSNQFWKTVADAGFVGLGFDTNAAIELQRLGLRGLLRQFDAAGLTKIVKEKSIQLSSDRFEDLWIRGLLTYHLGQHDPARLANAGDLLQQAVKFADQAQNLTDVSRIRYLQALIEFKLQHPQQTIALLEQMPDVPGTPDLTLAEDILWLKCRATILLSQADSLQTGAALAALDEFVARFPRSRNLPQAEFERLKLSNRLLPAEEALRKFSEIQDSDSYFVDAQFEMVRIQHQIWQNALQTRSQAEQQEFDELVSLDKQFREIPDVGAVRKLSSVLCVVDASLKRETEKSAIDHWLALAGQIGQQLPINDPSQTQLIYFRFLSARKFGDDTRAATFANWILDSSNERSYQLAALAFLAKYADESPDIPDHEVIEIYQKLADLLGTDKQAIAGSSNARAAAGRLVELYIDADQPDEARRLNEVLLDWNSQQEQFVFNAARIEMQAGNVSQALAYWRRLVQGTATGSPTWLEAKLGIVACLVESDPELAGKVFRQAVNLAGEISAEWQHRIVEMDAELKLSKMEAETDDLDRK